MNVLTASTAAIHAALKPTEELSCLSSRAKPPVLWGSVVRENMQSVTQQVGASTEDLKKLSHRLQELAE